MPDAPDPSAPVVGRVNRIADGGSERYGRYVVLDLRRDDPTGPVTLGGLEVYVLAFMALTGDEPVVGDDYVVSLERLTPTPPP